MDLYEQMRKLIAALESVGIPYALCGGLAMAVHRFPRATMDIDLLIEEASLKRTKRVAKGLGYDVDAGLMRLGGGRVNIYRLTLIERESGDVLPLDLLLVSPQLQSVWDTRETVAWEGRPLHVVSREGLIALKKLRYSGQDKDDIRRLEEGA